MDTTWEVIEGRCGGCRRFVRDFEGGGGSAYGHCGRKPRSGAIASTDFKCDVYESASATATPAPRSTPPGRKQIDVFADPAAIIRDLDETPRRQTAARRQSARVSVPARPARGSRDHEPVELGGEEMDRGTLKAIIQEALEDSLGIGDVTLMDRYVGGRVDIIPADEGLQPKSIPIDTLLRKIVMVRENLRMLEAKVNQNNRLSDADRIQLQQYITRCYGSLTTFNTLFKDKADHFKGSGR